MLATKNPCQPSTTQVMLLIAIEMISNHRNERWLLHPMIAFLIHRYLKISYVEVHCEI